MRPPRGRRPRVRGRGEGDGTLRGASSALPRDVLPYSVRVETVELTTLARAGGCAAKYSAARLETLLAGLVPADAEDLLVGLDPADDAAVYRLDDERAIVFTVDFFPPLVDDPRTFGAIAATNALNDVFAMGGAPLLALSVTAFPEELPVEVLGEVLAGARRARSCSGRDPRGRPHDSRQRAEVRARGRRPGASGTDLAEGRSTPGRRPLPHEAARHRPRAAGAAGRNRAGGRARGSRRLHDRAEPLGCGRHPAVRAQRGHRCDGVRPARAHVRARVAQRRAGRHRRRGAPGAPRQPSSSRPTV